MESYFLATNPDADEKHHGRASKITVKEEEATFDNDFTHIYATPACSFWEHLGAKIKLMKVLLKNGTQDYVMDQVCYTLGKWLQRSTSGRRPHAKNKNHES